MRAHHVIALDEGWLVYADLDGGAPTSRVVRNAGVIIRVASIDPAGSIGGLRASVETLADRSGSGPLMP